MTNSGICHIVQLMSKNLFEYIADARQKNASDEQIKNKLLSSGWPQNKVNAAFSVQNLVQAVPEPPAVPYSGMWIGFIYILFFISLYILTGALAGIFHSWINTKIPDLLSFDNAYTSYIQIDSDTILRTYLAMILISYPVCILLGVLIKIYIKRNRIMANSRARRLLIYITLIGTYITLIWNIIAAMYYLLAGAVVLNIVCNFSITLLISGGLFLYYVSEVKNDAKFN